MFVDEIEDSTIVDEPWQTADNYSHNFNGIDKLEIAIEPNLWVLGLDPDVLALAVRLRAQLTGLRLPTPKPVVSPDATTHCRLQAGREAKLLGRR